MFSAIHKELSAMHFDIQQKAQAYLHYTNEIRQGGDLLDIIVADFLWMRN